MSRVEILQSLLEWKAPLHILEERLSALPWEAEGPSVNVTKQHLANALSQYLAGERTEQQIELWANLIEGREDLTMDSEVRDSIYRLANPLLEGELSVEAAERFLLSGSF